jgi:GNAT superfamily N-acetyltransferase
MKSGFDEYTLDNHVKKQSADRYGYAATYGNIFVGCPSGLDYKNYEDYSGWFYLTDLFVEKGVRGQGLGGLLLTLLEDYIVGIRVKHLWAWTAGYKDPDFYK